MRAGDKSKNTRYKYGAKAGFWIAAEATATIIFARMHLHGFSGAYCLTCKVWRAGASERSENE
jgi:hypothetical protein